MKYNLTLFLCILFVLPLVVYLAWKMWVCCILYPDLNAMEAGLSRQEAGQAPVVAAAPQANGGNS